jgi:predicted small secreted protein
MKHRYLLLIIIAATLLSACASRQAGTDNASAGQAAKDKNKAASVEGEIIGKPAPNSKFAKLKIGMTLPQVEKLIGPPTKQWQHPTGKMSIPFYFGPDRWVIQYAYKGEGVLQFNYGEEQFLTRIEVNKAEKAE